jgi:NADH dehydrogenase
MHTLSTLAVRCLIGQGDCTAPSGENRLATCGAQKRSGHMASKSSLQGKLVTLIGGSGFFGRHIGQALLRRGARVRIASRNPHQAWKLKAPADLGQIQFMACDVMRDESLAMAVDGAESAVYLVGAFDGPLDALMRFGAGNAAKAAKAAGARSFVQISAIGADPESSLDYARTKGQGEQLVREHFADATIMRPSILFGEDDEFVNMFARLISSAPALPVFGPDARIQPVHVDDAALAVVAALEAPEKHGGKVYELAGPDVMTMGALNRRIAAAQNRDPLFIDLPDSVSGLIAFATGWLPGAPIDSDKWQMLKRGNVASGDHPGIEKLGVSPRPLDLFLDRWMVQYRKHGRFGTKVSAVER